MKRLFSLCLVVLMLLSLFTGCGSDKPSSKLSFSTTDLNDIKKLDGETVYITGYMSTLSPIDGSFMYLLNLPYQSCPFCEPNSTTLSNTIAIYAPNGKKFEFTDRLIKVTGTLEYSDDAAFTDQYGYQYRFRIVNASYEVVNTSELGEHLQLWQSLASTDVISNVYAMYDYINFLCFWGTYTYPWESGEDYLYPSDLPYFLYNEGAQFNYGYVEGYFDDMIKQIESVDKTAFADLVTNIKQAESFAEEVLLAIENQEYEFVDEYTKNASGSLQFGDGRMQYRMNDAEQYSNKMTTLYQAFASWLAQWEV